MITALRSATADWSQKDNVVGTRSHQTMLGLQLVQYDTQYLL